MELKRNLSRLDPYMSVFVISLLAIGFLAIASSTRTLNGQSRYFIVQGAAAFVGILSLYMIIKIDYDYIGQLASYIFIFNILILLLVLFIGQGEEVGTKGWIRFGFVGIQPAEIVKIGFIITFAKHIDSIYEEINEPRNVLLLLLHGGITIGLVLLQPDFGTSMVYVTIMLGMLFIAGISWKYIASAFSLLGVVAPLAWFFLLEDFQQKRFFAFLNPEADPLGYGYHVLQSKIAIGSGKLLGRGLFGGVQTQLNYLPEKQTDFVYAVIGEEMGFCGTILVLGLLVAIIARCFYTGKNSRDVFGELLCTGVGFMFLFHVFENIGMCIGLAPVTGIPLPFISYGGSNMLTSMLGIAIVMNVRSRRKRINF